MMDEFTDIENKELNCQKPSRSVGRIAGEILAGMATGVAVAVPVLYVILCVIVRAVWGEEKNLGVGGFVVVGFVFLAFPVLYGPATAVGVHLVGSRSTQTGSFLQTLASGFLGGLVMLVVLPLVWFLSTVLIVGVAQIVSWSLWALALLIPPAAATLSFNWTRRCRELPSS